MSPRPWSRRSTPVPPSSNSIPTKRPLFEKIETIAKEIYRAKNVTADQVGQGSAQGLEGIGFGKVAICIAKTQQQLLTATDVKGAPVDHTITCARMPVLNSSWWCAARSYHMPPAARAGGGLDRCRKRMQVLSGR